MEPSEEVPPMSDYDPAMPILHVYAASSFHESVFVSGNRAGLEVLKAAVERALAGEAPGQEAPVCFHNDGEGSPLIVEAFEQEVAEKLILPYTEDYARDQREGAVRPWYVYGNRLKGNKLHG